MLLGLLLAACASRLPVTAVHEDAPNLWCFPALVKDGEAHQMMGCADSYRLCTRALERAQTWGKVAGVMQLGPCERWAAR
jgi:hypothetical protein